ncbi:MAG TPA: 5'-nucleotidase C-terminal domain-containing protein [Herpetosiphonaceae bacterium]|nr:5'-nucleotidase C-terminal domain-containing protein [Herpetosiphonaceae bacterium]
MKLFRFGSLFALLVLVGTLVPVSLAANSARRAQAPNAVVNIQFLNVSDWHGQLDPLNNESGSAAEVAAIWQYWRGKNRNTITLTAGDDFGASPPLSAYFDEVPAVKAQRMMGIQVNTFGNHNFDRGVAHLQRMIDVAAAPTQQLTTTQPYTDGLPYSYVAANLENITGVLTGVERFKIIDMDGVQVAIIGLVNEEADQLTDPSNLGPLVVTNSAAAAMQARADAAAQGADVFVAITHKGIDSNGTGKLTEFAQAVNGFDIIFGDHTDANYVGTINGALVVENSSKAAKYVKIDLAYDTTANSVVSKTALGSQPTKLSTFIDSFPVGSRPTLVPDPAIGVMLAPYRTALAKVYDIPIGVTNGYFPRINNWERQGEAAVGNIVADTLRARYGTQIAVVNSGGERAPFPSSYAPVNRELRRSGGNYKLGPQFDLVIGDVYSVLPFGNSIVTRSVTGGQIWRMMENGVSQFPALDGRFPQISGFKFTFDGSKPANSRVLSVTLDDGTAVISNTTSSYTLLTTDFLNLGNDGYDVLEEGQQGETLEVMADILLEEIQRTGIITPTEFGRMLNVTRLTTFADQVIAKDTSTPVIPFTIGDPKLTTDPTTTTVTLKATSSNATLVPNTSVIFGGSGVNRTVQVTPAAGKTGIAVIHVEVTGTSKAFETLVVIVNDPPTIDTSAASVTQDEDKPATVEVGVRDLDTRNQDLTVTATAANNILVPAQTLAFSGSGITRTLTITPAANLSGTTALTVQVSDGVSTITKTLDVTFTAVNDAPTISAIADQTVLVGQSTGALTFSIADFDNAAGTLQVTAESSNTALVPNANVVIGGTGANRTVTVTPAANQTGVTTIELIVSDGSKTSTETFTVTVQAEPEYNLFLPFVVNKTITR